MQIEFPFNTTQREAFRSGRLMEEWAVKYPQLFDEREVEITRNQLPYHFFEWLGAVLLYEAMGYLSLVEKYETASHPRKLEIFHQAVPTEVFDYVVANRSGVPDLFVYSPHFQNWFFCEIKGPNDILRSHQIERHSALEELSGKPVMIMKLNERTL